MSLYAGIQVANRPDLENIRKLDLLPQSMIRSMQRYGIAIDKGHFREVSLQLESQSKLLREEICDYIPPDKLDEFIRRSNLNDEDYLPMNVNSSDQLALLLFEVLGVGHGKALKTTPWTIEKG